MGRELIEKLKMKFMIVRYYQIKIKLLGYLGKMADYVIRNKKGFEDPGAQETWREMRRLCTEEVKQLKEGKHE